MVANGAEDTTTSQQTPMDQFPVKWCCFTVCSTGRTAEPLHWVAPLSTDFGHLPQVGFNGGAHSLCIQLQTLKS